jgi:hypothetical protein
MKRGIILLILCVSLVGSFGVQKVFATINSENLRQVREDIIQTLGATKVENITAPTAPDQAAKDEYIGLITSRVTSYFNSVSGDQSMTDAAFRSGAADQVLRTMQAEQSIAASLRNIQDPVERLKRQQVVDMARSYYGPVQAVFQKSTVTNQYEKGVIDATTRDKEIKNADATLKQRQENLAGVAAAVKEGSKKCISLTGGFSLVDCLDIAAAWIVKSIAMQIAGFLLWTSANMMNFAIKIGIVEFARWAPDTLYPIWLVVRQIISLFIVFAGLWLGFMYIINKEDKFQRYVPWIIMFALFVNFSYPLVRMLTDVSNIVSLNIYTSALGTEALTNELTSGNSAGAIIVNRLGFVNLATKVVDFGKSNTTGYLDGLDSTPGAVLGVAFLLYATYVFAFATVIILMRSAILVFIIHLSLINLSYSGSSSRSLLTFALTPPILVW